MIGLADLVPIPLIPPAPGLPAAAGELDVDPELSVPEIERDVVLGGGGDLATCVVPDPLLLLLVVPLFPSVPLAFMGRLFPFEWAAAAAALCC